MSEIGIIGEFDGFCIIHHHRRRRPPEAEEK